MMASSFAAAAFSNFFSRMLSIHSSFLLMVVFLPCSIMMMTTTTMVASAADLNTILNAMPSIDADAAQSKVSIGIEAAFATANVSLLDGTILRQESITASNSSSELVEQVNSHMNSAVMCVIGPGSDEDLVSLLASASLKAKHVVFMSPFTQTSAVRRWDSHMYFTTPPPSAELLALLSYALSACRSVQVGFMYVADSGLGANELNYLNRQLASQGLPAAVVYKQKANSDVLDLQDLEFFIDEMPDVVFIFGTVGAATLHFFEAIVQSNDLLLHETLVMSPFSLMKDLVASYERLLGAAYASDQREDVLAAIMPPSRLFFSSPVPLVSDERYPAVTAAFLSSLRSATNQGALTNSVDKVLAFSGWVGAQVAIQAARRHGYGTRDAFAESLFLQNRYVVEDELIIGDYGGPCKGFLSSSSGGMACSCNQGGHAVFLSTLAVMNQAHHEEEEGEGEGGADDDEERGEEVFVIKRPHRGTRIPTVLVTVPSGNFKYDVDTCYPTEILSAPIHTMGLNITDVPSLRYVFDQDVLTAMNVSNAMYSKHKIFVSTITASQEEIVGRLEDWVVAYPLDVIIGPVPRHISSYAAKTLIIDPISTFTSSSSTRPTTIYISPTLDQEIFILNKFFDFRSMSKTAIIYASDAYLQERDAQDFLQMGDWEVHAESHFDFFPEGDMNAAGGTFFINLPEEFIRHVLAFLYKNKDAMVAVLSDDITKMYDLFVEEASWGKDVMSRLIFVTNLPHWAPPADGYEDAIAEKFHATIRDPAYYTPAGMRGYLAARFLDTISSDIDVISSEALVTNIQRHQYIVIDGMTFGPYTAPCEKVFDAPIAGSASASASSVLYASSTFSSSSQPDRQQDDSSHRLYHHEDGGADLFAPDSPRWEWVEEECGRNYGARDLVIWSFARCLDRNIAPLTQPETPYVPTLPQGDDHDVFTDYQGRFRPWIIGLITGLALLLVFLVVVLFVFYTYFYKRNSRDNRSAPTRQDEPVTIMFTDIESSTALWSAVTHDMSTAVAMHHKIIRDLIVKYKCYEVKTIGDAFMIVTHDAFAAVRLAQEIQYAFMQHDWGTDQIDAVYRSMHKKRNKNNKKGNNMPDDATTESAAAAPYAECWNGIRVRIGMHTGHPDICFDGVTKGYDYYGDASNTAARTEALGHGGQIIVTEYTWNALSQEEQDALTVRPLGAQYLRGVAGQIYMYEITSVPQRTFPPIMTTTSVPSPGVFSPAASMSGAFRGVDKNAVAAAVGSLLERSQQASPPPPPPPPSGADMSCGDPFHAVGSGTVEVEDDEDDDDFEQIAQAEAAMQAQKENAADVLEAYLAPRTTKERVKMLEEACRLFVMTVPDRRQHNSEEAYLEALLGCVATRTAFIVNYRHRLRDEALLLQQQQQQQQQLLLQQQQQQQHQVQQKHPHLHEEDKRAPEKSSSSSAPSPPPQQQQTRTWVAFEKPTASFTEMYSSNDMLSASDSEKQLLDERRGGGSGHTLGHKKQHLMLSMMLSAGSPTAMYEMDNRNPFLVGPTSPAIKNGNSNNTHVSHDDPVTATTSGNLENVTEEEEEEPMMLSAMLGAGSPTTMYETDNRNSFLIGPSSPVSNNNNNNNNNNEDELAATTTSGEGDIVYLSPAASPSRRKKTMAMQFINGAPTLQGDCTLKCFEAGLLYRITDSATQQWGYYNDTLRYVMSVSFSFGRQSTFTPAPGVTLRMSEETGRYEGTLMIPPASTALMGRGTINGYKLYYTAKPIRKTEEKKE